MNEVESKKTEANASKIQSILNYSTVSISIQELCNKLALSFEEVILAIRWLSKEINIGLSVEEEQLLLIPSRI
ncbi:hypothetical protein D0T50_11250 [Bacteroides sp. 214]|uniref:winged helix-turn-helix domain-containing protein n=1 Tax=Bacteroides sp. 214 TaxID=2302935 RepID=UPI0013D24D99|nr:winged helix-turn-helix domain-containing protein [Bacteroides sp. 214]NDW13465.1 hypothetical protein [Bacteroides sp. 214]